MRGGYLLQALLIVNIAVCGYLVYLIGDFHRDTKYLKQTLQETAHIVHHLPTTEQASAWLTDRGEWLKKATEWATKKKNKSR